MIGDRTQRATGQGQATDTRSDDRLRDVLHVGNRLSNGQWGFLYRDLTFNTEPPRSSEPADYAVRNVYNVKNTVENFDIGVRLLGTENANIFLNIFRCNGITISLEEEENTTIRSNDILPDRLCGG